MADDDAFHHLFPLPPHRAGLPHHLPDGGGRSGEIVLRPGQGGGKPGICVFQVRQIDVHLALQLTQGLHPLIAAAVVHHGYGQLRRQGRQDRGQEMGGGHQVDVLRAPGDQVFKQPPQLGGVHGLSHRAAADGGILAIFAPQGAAAEKHRAAAAVSCQGRLFPFVEHTFRHQRGAGTAAEAGLPGAAVRAALPGAQLTVYIIHRYRHPLAIS